MVDIIFFIYTLYQIIATLIVNTNKRDFFM